MRAKRMERAFFVIHTLEELLRTGDYIRCSEYMQHGDTSVLLHCIAVTCCAMDILAFLGIRYDMRALARGGLLHDFFLYDWHTHITPPEERKHAFSHPIVAERNANARWSLNDKESDIILHHMFPVTFTLPSSREAVAICVADKFCALYETFCRHGAYPKLRYLCAHVPELRKVFSTEKQIPER